MDRDSIKQVVQAYLPGADENQVLALTEKAEREIEAAGREIVRKLVKKAIAGSFEAGGIIDTRA